MNRTFPRLHRIVAALVMTVCTAAPSWSAPHLKEKIAGYLFAHMTSRDYGHLYYSVSTDGLHWRNLNGGKRILGDEYWGHPDICRGRDGRYYLMGNAPWEPYRNLGVWVSDHLVHWKLYSKHVIDVSSVHGFEHNGGNAGAPKVFYDTASKTYIVTWHTSRVKREPKNELPFWNGQRTFYETSPDLKTFSQPKRLFPKWHFPTIDVIIRREGDRYYAILKDETYPSYQWPTGKGIRWASAPTPYGPWTQPSARITPNFREAPTLIPRRDGTGWYLYYEQYPGIQYGLSTAPTLAGPWYDLFIQQYSVPPHSRHGSMIPLNKEEWDTLLAAYSKPATPLK